MSKSPTSTPPLLPAQVIIHASLETAVEIVRLHPDVSLPYRAYEQSAAFDLYAYLKSQDGRERTATLGPGIVQSIPTGLCICPPRGHCVLVCSRSGFAADGVFVANAPGIIDPDYTGEIKVLLINGGLKPFYVKHGMRIAQAMIVPFTHFPLREVKEFPPTARGDKGFGSTGA